MEKLLRYRLTDSKTAADLKNNAEGLMRVGIQPSIDTLIYIKLAEYEDQQENQKILWKEGKNA